MSQTTEEKYMKKYLIALTLWLVALTAVAQDSGLYMDETRFGEGITITRNGDILQFFFFTYEPQPECWNFLNLPEVTDWAEHDCHEARWFLSGGDELIGDTVTGFLYQTVGIDYPEGIADPDDPFATTVGDDFVIGLYILRRQGEGWRLVVFPVGDALPIDDILFTTTFDFNHAILHANDPEPEINPE